MDRDAEATKRRLLDAARDEFAAYGIAGARVDRIAAAGRANKAQIYHYFGGKGALFDAVFDEMVRQTLDEVPIDPADLPGYAGRLHDSYRRRPWVQRLAMWHRLERGDRDHDLIATVVAANSAKARSITRAQDGGLLPRHFTAEELLTLVIQISATWSLPLPEYGVNPDATGEARQRQVVIDAVAAILGRPRDGAAASSSGPSEDTDPM